MPDIIFTRIDKVKTKPEFNWLLALIICLLWTLILFPAGFFTIIMADFAEPSKETVYLIWAYTYLFTMFLAASAVGYFSPIPGKTIKEYEAIVENEKDLKEIKKEFIIISYDPYTKICELREKEKLKNNKEKKKK